MPVISSATWFCCAGSTNRAGYKGLKNLGDAAAIEIPEDRDLKRWTALQQHRERHKLASLLNRKKSDGEKDKREGKPFDPSLALDYDLTMLETINAPGRNMTKTV
jgi:hypothetical protein